MVSKSEGTEKISVCRFRLRARPSVIADDREISFHLIGVIFARERVLPL